MVGVPILGVPVVAVGLVPIERPPFVVGQDLSVAGGGLGGPVGAQLDVPALNGHHRLAGSFVQTERGFSSRHDTGFSGSR